MALPTFARYGKVLNDASYWEEMWQLYLFTAYEDPAVGKGPGLWSPTHNLFYRDATYFNKTSPNGMPVFWGRGNGWAVAAMARAIAELPLSHPYSVEFQIKLQKLAASLKALQGADGLWRANLLDATAIPNPETTGSAMFTYAIAWGVNNDILVRSDYEAVVEAAWTGLSTISLQSDGLVGWCQPPNGQPAPATQTDTSDFCVGQFLLAGSEVMKMYGGK
jgi:unsaturated rhamnogalacturonyl hydrolase